MNEVQETVKQFVLSEFLPGESPDELTGSTPLIKGGILDSISTLRLVAFLEETFSIQVEAHEMQEDNLGTLAAITAFVNEKSAA